MLALFPPLLVYIGGAEVEQVKSFKFLGVNINNDLTWSNHTEVNTQSLQDKINAVHSILLSQTQNITTIPWGIVLLGSASAYPVEAPGEFRYVGVQFDVVSPGSFLSRARWKEVSGSGLGALMELRPQDAALPTSGSLSSGLDGLSLGADGASSLGSDSETNGEAGMPQADRYGFLGGSQFTGEAMRIPAEVIREREKKWLEMEQDWSKWITRKHKKIQLRCRKGIPGSMRSRIWPLLCGGRFRMQQNKNIFKVLDEAVGDRRWLDAIEKDLHRQFPFHEMFLSREGTGQQDLYRVLKAYSIYKPEEGYCQAQGPLAAVLLMQMPAEDAFWCLVQICEYYVPGYYSPGLGGVQLDGQVLFGLLRKVSPVAYRHLKKHEVDPLLYMTEWFMCLFTRTLPWATMLRVWDMFLSEGVKVIFRVALFLLKVMLGHSDKLKDCQGLVETLEKLRNIPQRILQDNVLIHEISELPISASTIDRETSRQKKKWSRTRGGMLPPPVPSSRLHGARAIHTSSPHHPPSSALPPTLPPLIAPSPAPSIQVWPAQGPGAQQDSQRVPATRSRTFYVRRPSRPPQVPPRRGGEVRGVEGGGEHSKRHSLPPSSSDTYF